MNESGVLIPSERKGGTIRLKGRLHLPESAGPAPGVVVCHPHPAGGGEMDVGLIGLLANGLCSTGMAALRFNFAGVGGSEGVFSDGVEEPGDVHAAFDYLKGLPEVDADRISIAGWSFGAWMGLMAVAGGLPAKAIVAIAPPLIAYEWWGNTRALAASATERYYIAGDRDQFCPLNTLNDFAVDISEEDVKNVSILTGADHFLIRRETEVIGLAVARLRA